MTIHPIEAVVFDLDGVVTDTARAHSAAWKQAFDEFLRARDGESFVPFDREADYLRYVDGKPRYEGVASFLASRGIELRWGDPDDSPGHHTVCALGNRKNELFGEYLRAGEVDVFESSVALIKELRRRGIQTAVVSSSKNCGRVLQAAGLSDLFEVRVDGLDLARSELRGKPEPDMFLEAARRLGVSPDRAVVFEDAVAGVAAGRAGGFGQVVGVDRANQAQALKRAGADRVIRDLREWNVNDEIASGHMSQKGHALEHVDELVDRARTCRLAVFLDYDGTLSPIVERPEDAIISKEMREAVAGLANIVTVAVISGRDLPDVRRRVGLFNIAYAGSHGFDVADSHGQRIDLEHGKLAYDEELGPMLEDAANALRAGLQSIAGAHLEQKRYSLAVHYRQARADDIPGVEAVVDRVMERYDGLRKTHGKKVFDLQPDIDWHKGKALGWLLEQLGLAGPGVLPIYIGDDVTDEDAFESLKGHGVGIVVRDDDRPSAAAYELRDPDEVRRFIEELTHKLAHLEGAS